MATWQLIGDVNLGVPGILSWDGVQLSGTPEAMAAVDELHRVGSVALAPTGPWLTTDPTDPVCAFAMAVAIMQSDDATGDPPKLPIPRLPKGAVA